MKLFPQMYLLTILQPFIHPMFGELCGLDMSVVSKRELSSVLANTIQPLPDASLHKTTEDGRQIWHPNFLGHVDDEVNIKFISEVATRVFDNETVSTSSLCEPEIYFVTSARSWCHPNVSEGLFSNHP
jgi:hypothetical protein